MARLVMLDRDGVLNVDRPRSVRHPDELEMIDGAAAAVARLNRAGLRVALVSNQAVVGRGEIDRAMLDAIQARLRQCRATRSAKRGCVMPATASQCSAQYASSSPAARALVATATVPSQAQACQASTASAQLSRWISTRSRRRTPRLCMPPAMRCTRAANSAQL